MANRPTAGGVRVATTLALAVAQPLVPALWRLTGRATPEVERAAADAGPVTPDDRAFVIWGPLFAGSLAYAVSEARRCRAGEPTAGRAGRWAAAALAGNVAWSLNSQLRRLDEASVALILGSAAAATTAVVRDGRDRRGGGLLGPSFGALAGWLCVAAVANVETALNLRRGRPDDRKSTRRAALLVGVASTAAAAVATAVRGNPAFALAAGWGLGGVAVKARRHRQPAVVATAAGGLIAVAAAALRARGR